MKPTILTFALRMAPDSGGMSAGSDEAAKERLRELIEAWFELIGREKTQRYLRILAKRMAERETNVVALHGTAPSEALDAWLRAVIPVWLAKHG